MSILELGVEFDDVASRVSVLLPAEIDALTSTKKIVKNRYTTLENFVKTSLVTFII